MTITQGDGSSIYTPTEVSGSNNIVVVVGGGQVPPSTPTESQTLLEKLHETLIRYGINPTYLGGALAIYSLDALQNADPTATQYEQIELNDHVSAVHKFAAMLLPPKT